ncbi:ATP-binding protein [Noviherbaspirillum sp. CPCC 100848]|uniref:histidine kinase n=1 Tax=Noviherbaspirillum album TaxID=3080276 RepID=A0ABU6J8T5_9BURK|nr:ATP-binding protein [Noviherbaspirillum sp. CPCC 100848]MEC4720054.1 ATP-binding protein [Noviherbaspirillum sp. CPCC 100848]
MLTNKTVRLRSLLALLTALGLLPIALIGAWGIRAAIDQQQQQFEVSMLNLSRALASAVDAELESAVDTLGTLSHNQALVYGDLEGFYKVAGETARSKAEWISVILTDGNGNAIFKTSSPFGAVDTRINDPESLMRVIDEREPLVGKIVKGPRGEYAFPVRIPVIENGRLTYVLSAAIKPSRIMEFLQRQQMPPGWIVSVFDESNLRVARSKDQETTVATGPSPTLAALLAKGQSEGSGISRTLDDAEVLTAFARTSRYGWTVAVGAPDTYFRQALIKNLALYTAGIAASLLACIAFAFFIARRIVGAINGLQNQALQLVHSEPVKALPSFIEEVSDVSSVLESASRERRAIELEREQLLASLNKALANAEEAGHAKDNFLAVLGHELRNPLAPMVAALDLMDVRKEPANLRERQIMRRQVEHMKRLVDDLLDVSRITRGKLEIRHAPVDLVPVIEQAVESLQHAVARRSSGIRVHVPEAAWVMGDEARLQQVVTNLLNNALHFDPDGEISVGIAQDERLGETSIIIRDEGAGMLPETVAQIFEPFYQAPQSLARSSGGLGLGLAIVRSIVELHGGRVMVASSGLGLGSEFRVMLPSIAAPRQEPVPDDAVRDVQRRRILVVDDNVDAAEMLASLLRLQGHEVSIAHDARAALALLGKSVPDIAFLDIGLPDIDGFALAGMMRARLPGWRGKLIAVTGYGQEGDKDRAAEAGFDMHLTKPVDADTVFAAAC